MLFQPDKSYFIISMIKEVESHEARSNWKLIKNSEVNNKHKYKDLKSTVFYKFGISSKNKSNMGDY